MFTKKCREEISSPDRHFPGESRRHKELSSMAGEGHRKLELLQAWEEFARVPLPKKDKRTRFPLFQRDPGRGTLKVLQGEAGAVGAINYAAMNYDS